MKKKTRLLAFVLTIVLLCTMLPTMALASSTGDGKTIYRDLNGDGIKEEIRLDCYRSYFKITVNNESRTYYYTMNNGDFVYFYFLDINKKDNYVEIVVTDDICIGSEPEICNYVLRYTGNSLIEATVQAKNSSILDYIPSKRASLKTDGAGTLIAPYYGRNCTYKLKSGFVLKQVTTKAVKLSKSSTSLAKGKTTTLKATVTGLSSKSVKWKSSNTKVATVSSKGKVTAKGVGTATITCTSKADGKYKAACKVTTYALPTKVFSTFSNGSKTYKTNLYGSSKKETLKISMKKGKRTEYGYIYSLVLSVGKSKVNLGAADVNGSVEVYVGDINSKDKFKEIFVLYNGSDVGTDCYILRYNGKILQKMKATYTDWTGRKYKNKPYVVMIKDYSKSSIRLYGSGVIGLSDFQHNSYYNEKLIYSKYIMSSKFKLTEK